VVLVQWAFDPYPFIFLNLLLSMARGPAGSVIMMSQNGRQRRTAWRPRSTTRFNIKPNRRSPTCTTRLTA